MSMLERSELTKIAKARIRDAEILHESGRYDGSTYLCGYAIEMALKARICKNLKMEGFPSSKKEFKDKKKLRTHDLDNLLSFSGMEEKIKTNEECLVAWSEVGDWDPQIRYNPIGSFTDKDSKSMIDSSKKLLSVL